MSEFCWLANVHRGDRRERINCVSVFDCFSTSGLVCFPWKIRFGNSASSSTLMGDGDGGGGGDVVGFIFCLVGWLVKQQAKQQIFTSHVKPYTPSNKRRENIGSWATSSSPTTLVSLFLSSSSFVIHIIVAVAVRPRQPRRRSSSSSYAWIFQCESFFWQYKPNVLVIECQLKVRRVTISIVSVDGALVSKIQIRDDVSNRKH